MTKNANRKSKLIDEHEAIDNALPTTNRIDIA